MSLRLELTFSFARALALAALFIALSGAVGIVLDYTPLVQWRSSFPPISMPACVSLMCLSVAVRIIAAPHK